MGNRLILLKKNEEEKRKKMKRMWVEFNCGSGLYFVSWFACLFPFLVMCVLSFVVLSCCVNSCLIFFLFFFILFSMLGEKPVYLFKDIKKMQ